MEWIQEARKLGIELEPGEIITAAEARTIVYEAELFAQTDILRAKVGRRDVTFPEVAELAGALHDLTLETQKSKKAGRRHLAAARRRHAAAECLSVSTPTRQ